MCFTTTLKDGKLLPLTLKPDDYKPHELPPGQAYVGDQRITVVEHDYPLEKHGAWIANKNKERYSAPESIIDERIRGIFSG
jgi:hypothetical protein